MTENRYRPSSPVRRYPDPRASTGMVYSSSFDGNRYNPQPRTTYDSFPTPRHGSSYTTQPIRKTFLDDHHPGGGFVRTEYSVRPRNNSAVPEQRRPISTYVPRPASPPRNRYPVVTSSFREDPRYHHAPVREERYLQPASGQPRHHQRHSSATYADQERLNSSRVNKQPEYHRRGGYNQYPSNSSGGAPPHDEGFSYTTPKEQFLQESARPPVRRDSYSRRERPVSIMGLQEYRAPPPRREGPPPASSRAALERLERDPQRPSRGGDSDPERDRGSDVPRRRHSMRTPAVLHHYRDDRDGYTSDNRPPNRPRHERIDEEDRPKNRYYEDRDRATVREPDRARERDKDRDRDRDRDRERDKVRDRDIDKERDRDRDRERDRDRDRDRDRARDNDRSTKTTDERRIPRSREPSPENAGLRKGVATAAGLAAAGGLVGLATKGSRASPVEDESDEHKGRKNRRRRHRDDDVDVDDLGNRFERDMAISNGDKSDRRRPEPRNEDPVDGQDDRRERRRHHRKHKDRSSRQEESDTTEDSADRDVNSRGQSRERTSEARGATRLRHSTRDPSREDERFSTNAEPRTVSPGDAEDTRPRRVQLVEPNDKKDEVRPRGILKKPREQPFPEDPNPEREGVAPLKDATKDGVPPNARWTKISRALVNPEALEKSHERFEEKDDYVIVLRVISREEIMKLADKTKEIRGKCSL